MKAISLHQPWASLLVTRQPDDSAYDHWRHTGDADAAAALDGLAMVKRFETRSWPCPPALIGERIIFHATKRKPTVEGIQGLERIGDWWVEDDRLGGFTMHHHGPDSTDIPLPLGAVVGSGRITASLPIIEVPIPADCIVRVNGTLRHYHDPEYPGSHDDITDQLPYGDFTPAGGGGRCAGGYVGVHDEHQGPDRASCSSCGRSIGFDRTTGRFKTHQRPPGRYAWLIEDAAPTTERCPWCWGTGGFKRRGPYVIDSYLDVWEPCPVCTSNPLLSTGAGRCDPTPARGRQRIWNWEPA